MVYVIIYFYIIIYSYALSVDPYRRVTYNEIDQKTQKKHWCVENRISPYSEVIEIQPFVCWHLLPPKRPRIVAPPRSSPPYERQLHFCSRTHKDVMSSRQSTQWKDITAGAGGSHSQADLSISSEYETGSQIAYRKRKQRDCKEQTPRWC